MNFLLVPHAALDGELSSWINDAGTVIFYLAVWGLVFAGTGLFIGVFIPFITVGFYFFFSEISYHLSNHQLVFIQGKVHGVLF
jgi:hypothetical protein